jgi:recombination protein RecA
VGDLHGEGWLVVARKLKPVESGDRVSALLREMKGVELTRGSDPELKVVLQPIGIPQIDEIIGGGIPLNRYTEIYGGASHGKTLLCQFITRAFQQAGHIVAYVDVEQTFDPKWWEQTGVDVEELIVGQPPYGEKAVDMISALVGNVGLIIVDSVAALVPLRAQEEDAEVSMMGRQAQLVNRLFYNTLGKMKKSGTAMILINQVRVDFKNQYGVKLPGGDSQNFYSSIQMGIARREWIQRGVQGPKTGYNMEVSVTKNKLGTPLGKTKLPIDFTGDFDYTTLVISDALDRGVIQHAGAWYRLPSSIAFDHEEDWDQSKISRIPETGQIRVMGRELLHEFINGNEVARKQLESLVYADELEPKSEALA